MQTWSVGGDWRPHHLISTDCRNRVFHAGWELSPEKPVLAHPSALTLSTDSPVLSSIHSLPPFRSGSLHTELLKSQDGIRSPRSPSISLTMSISVLGLFLLLASTPSSGAAHSDSDMELAQKYLGRYGYLGGSNPTHMSLAHIRPALLAFQKMAGLNRSGVLDTATLSTMSRPRCANSDFLDQDPQNRTGSQSDRFRLIGTKWPSRLVRYRVAQYSRQPVSSRTVDQTLDQAFQMWSQHVDLRFVRVEDDGTEVDIEVRFTEGEHGDRYPFWDETQLAHAFFPGQGLGGDVHLNDGVNWSPKNTLLYTLAHEIGHALGLGHSSSSSAIMFSHLLSLKDPPQLHSDDIQGIQAIYGARHEAPSPPTPAPTITTRPSLPPRTTKRPRPDTETGTGHGDICHDDFRIDAITSLDQGQILIFQGDYVHVLETREGRLVRKAPQLLRQLFSSRLPSNLDAVFSRATKTYFLKGDLFWRSSTGWDMDAGYPKQIRDHFPGVPDHVDAAFVGKNEHIFILKGGECWEVDPRRRRGRSSSHPIGFHWKGLPDRDLDAVFRSPQGLTYFFQGQRFWRLNDTTQTVSLSDPPYPRDARKWWFSCQNF